jgi:hypothetical protein
MCGRIGNKGSEGRSVGDGLIFECGNESCPAAGIGGRGKNQFGGAETRSNMTSTRCASSDLWIDITGE